MKVEWVRVCDVMAIDRTPVSLEEGLEYRRIGIYSWGRGMIHHPPAPAAGMGSLRYFRFPADALVLSNIQAWEQAVAVSTQDEAAGFVCSNRFLPYVPHAHEVDLRYVLHFLLSEPGHELLKRASPGTQVRNRTLGKRLFEESLIPFPPIDDQRRIAAHLDRVGNIASNSASTVMRHAGALGVADLPTWLSRALASLPRVRVSELCESISDTIHPGDDRRGADRFVGLEHVEPHVGRSTTFRPLGEETGRKFRFEKGDVTYGYLRPYLNKVWAADGVGLCSVEQFVLRPRSGVDPELLSLVLRSNDMLSVANAATNNLQLPRLKLGTLLGTEVPDPREISEELSISLSQTEYRFVNVAELRKRQQDLVDGLLPSARNEIFNAMR